MANQPDIAKWFRGKVANVNQAGEDVLEAASERGAEYVRYYISTRGTGKTWTGDWSRRDNGTAGRTGSYPGRDASGEMLDAVDSWVSRGGGSADGRTRMAFGFTRARKDYFLAQEGGFRHNVTGETIEGMHAISDAAETIRQELETELPRHLRGA